MASLSLCSQFETNLMSNRKVIELVLNLNSAKAHGKNYIKVKPHLVHHLLRSRLFLDTLAVILRKKSEMCGEFFCPALEMQFCRFF